MTTEKWQRYIDDQCSEQEKIEMIRYLQTLSDTELRQQLSAEGSKDLLPMPADIANRLDTYIVSVTAGGSKRRPVRQLHWYWAAACIAVLAVGMAFLWQPLNRQHVVLASSKTYETIFNNANWSKKITLPVSSQVWLTPHSSLQYPSDYMTNDREIRLDGEAYFEVAPIAQRPFVVLSGDVKTIVLGTHFNIESYAEERDTRVSLTQGKVAVKVMQQNGADSSFLLSPGNRLVYQNSSRQVHTESFSGGYEDDWKKGAMVLNNIAVAAVFQRLERRFGKKIQFDAARFKQKRFTATWLRPDLQLILQNMAYVQGFTYRIAGDTVIIR